MNKVPLPSHHTVVVFLAAAMVAPCCAGELHWRWYAWRICTCEG